MGLIRMPSLLRLVGGNPTPSPPCGVGSGGVDSVLGSLGRIHGPSRVGSSGGREAVRQTIFCARRFCSETLGCPFGCFGRPYTFLLGSIQCKVTESILMTSRPPIIYYTLCDILYTLYSRVYIIYYRLCSVYMVYFIYYGETTQRKQSSSSHIASGHVRAQL